MKHYQSTAYCGCGACLVIDAGTMYCANPWCKGFRQRYKLPEIQLEPVQYFTHGDYEATQIIKEQSKLVAD